MKAIRHYWDDLGRSPGWYVEIIENGNIVAQSENISFLVDVDDYGRNEEAAMLAAVRLAYGI